jgi:hypothetical protein
MFAHEDLVIRDARPLCDAGKAFESKRRNPDWADL